MQVCVFRHPLAKSRICNNEIRQMQVYVFRHPLAKSRICNNETLKCKFVYLGMS